MEASGTTHRTKPAPSQASATAKEFVDEGAHEPAAAALKKPYERALLMWGPASQLTSDVGELWRDVREGNVDPPAGDFPQRLEGLRTGFSREYKGDLKKAGALGRDFLPPGKPNPPDFLAPGFTDDQLRAMLKAIDEREGTWRRLDADAEIVGIGHSVGLKDVEAYRLFKHLVDEGYVHPGRNLEVPDGHYTKVQSVGVGIINEIVTDEMRLLDRGRKAVGL